jgi:hypothetical protein
VQHVKRTFLILVNGYMSDMTADQIRAALAEAGARRRRAIRAELEARAEIMDLLRRGDGVVPVTEMHRLSGIPRSVIYEFLGGGRSKREVERLRTELQAAQAQLDARGD